MLELTYQISYRRLAKLSRSMRFKIFRASFLLAGLILAVLVAWLAGIAIYGDALDRWMLSVGISRGVGGILVGGSGVALWVASIILVSTLQRKQTERLVDQNVTIRLTKDDGGLRFASDAMEYYLKWQASVGCWWSATAWSSVQAASCSSSCRMPPSLMPNSGSLSFGTSYGRLGDKARSASDKYIRSVLDGRLAD